MRPVVILADFEEKYIDNLEVILLEKYGGQIELIEITTKEYLREFFSEQVLADELVISSSIYFQELDRHNLGKRIILDDDPSGKESHNGIVMNRYGDIKGILNEIDYGLQPLLSRESRKARTKTVGVTSAVGGSGKTSVSMGLARRLADEHKNVLYLNTQEIQSFQYYLENQEPLGKEGCRHLRNVLDEGFEVLRMEFRKEGFTYCPPLRYGREAQTIPFSVYGKIIKEAVETEDYDYIIVDMDNGCNHDNAELLQACDIVLIITLPDDMSAVKTGYLLRNMNCNDFEKYLFVENMCGKQIRRNNTLQERKGRKNEHIEKLQDPVTLEALGHSRGMERLAYMLL